MTEDLDEAAVYAALVEAARSEASFEERILAHAVRVYKDQADHWRLAVKAREDGRQRRSRKMLMKTVKLLRRRVRMAEAVSLQKTRMYNACSQEAGQLRARLRAQQERSCDSCEHMRYECSWNNPEDRNFVYQCNLWKIRCSTLGYVCGRWSLAADRRMP